MHWCKGERSNDIILMHKSAKFKVFRQSSLSHHGSEIIKYLTYNAYANWHIITFKPHFTAITVQVMKTKIKSIPGTFRVKRENAVVAGMYEKTLVAWFKSNLLLNLQVFDMRLLHKYN